MIEKLYNLNRSNARDDFIDLRKIGRNHAPGRILRGGTISRVGLTLGMI